MHARGGLKRLPPVGITISAGEISVGPSVDVSGQLRTRTGAFVESGYPHENSCSAAPADVLAVTGPKNPFRVREDGAFVFEGKVLDLGNTPASCSPLPTTGAGTRFMWIPQRGSVRWGRVPAGQTSWDDGNMNDFTFAGGNQVIAKGYGAFAYGDQVTVSSTVGVGFGSANTVSGTAGFSAGASNTCSGFTCIAVGYTTTASGQGSTALGYRTLATGDYTTALGNRASTNGFSGSFVWGDGAALSATQEVKNQAENEFRIRATGGIKRARASPRAPRPASRETPGATCPPARAYSAARRAATSKRTSRRSMARRCSSACPRCP